MRTEFQIQLPETFPQFFWLMHTNWCLQYDYQKKKRKWNILDDCICLPFWYVIEKIHNRNNVYCCISTVFYRFFRHLCLKRYFYLVLQISPLLFQNSCKRNTTSKIGLPSRHNTILRCPKTRLSMREIQFFSDVKWEIDKESFSGLETALQWVSFPTQLVEIISGRSVKVRHSESKLWCL